MSASEFVDLFGKEGGAERYASFRPEYPKDFIASIVAKCLEPPKEILDVGCGTGQATFLLAEHAEHVVGMDPSEGMVKEAQTQAQKLGELSHRLRFAVGGAEDLTAAGIPEGGFDLITAAQCAHWFDLPLFYDQVKAALKTNGTLAIFCYSRPTITDCPEAEAAFHKLYATTIGPHWPPSRKLIDEGYSSIKPPFPWGDRFESSMNYELNSEGLLNYVGTWSALQLAKKSDPNRDWLEEFRSALEKLGKDRVYKVKTPLYAILAYNTKAGAPSPFIYPHPSTVAQGFQGYGLSQDDLDSIAPPKLK